MGTTMTDDLTQGNADPRGTLSEQIAKAINGTLKPRPVQLPCCNCGKLITETEHAARADPGHMPICGECYSPPVIRCVECNAELRTDQTNGSGKCVYCLRRGFDTRAMLKTPSYPGKGAALDARIAAAQPTEPPRHPSDWDVWITPGGES